MRVLLEENKNKTKQNRASLRKQPTLGDATTGFPPLRVKGGMSLKNGMWHGLRNYMIMWNVIYAEWIKEIN